MTAAGARRVKHTAQFGHIARRRPIQTQACYNTQSRNAVNDEMLPFVSKYIAYKVPELGVRLMS